ncbi:Ff.00g011740.m01.CDS01 [Fusarium sp. VM40]|nr:Ff.00g011740.m01.CDS01 [Fusarium sp. VM40]
MASQAPIPVLTVSLSRHLNGRDINAGLEHQWSESKVPASTASRFSNVGFNLDANGNNLEELKSILKERDWSGIILGWCVRGHIEFTELFESVVAVCVDHIVQRKEGNIGEKEPKLIFCRGPDDLVNATLRNFPLDV